MSLKVDCNVCGESISLRKMPHGKHVAFDFNTDTPHTHSKGSLQKKVSELKTTEKSEIDNSVYDKVSNKKTEDILASISSTAQEEESSSNFSFNANTLNTNSDLPFEVIENEKKIKPTHVVIAILFVVILFLLLN